MLTVSFNNALVIELLVIEKFNRILIAMIFDRKFPKLRSMRYLKELPLFRGNCRNSMKALPILVNIHL